MTVKAYTIEDYALIAGWWEKRKFAVIPPEALPSIGFIVNNNAAGFLYVTDSTMGVMEWLVTNPDADKHERIKDLKKVIELISEAAKAMDVKLIFSSINNETLMSVYQDSGFVKTDTNMTNYLKKVS